MKNRRMKEKVKEFTDNADLKFLLDGWGEPKPKLEKAYEDKFNNEKEDTDDGRFELSTQTIVGEAKEE